MQYRVFIVFSIKLLCYNETAMYVTMSIARHVLDVKPSLYLNTNPDSKVHGANMGPTWRRQDPGGPHVGHMNLAIWEGFQFIYIVNLERP